MRSHGGALSKRSAGASAVAPSCASALRGRACLLLAALLASSGLAASAWATLDASDALPSIPPPHVRFPDAFDEQGCALIAREGSSPQRICPAKHGEPSSAGSADDWARFLGYQGPSPVSSRNGSGGVVVLPESLSVESRGWWRAAGLVRNDTDQVACEVRVTATLATADDRVFGRATVVVPVRDVRPGEPAPFELRTAVPVQAVRHVRWTASVAAGGTQSPTRMAEIEVGRVFPSPSDAAIGWGILRNWGSLPIPRVSVVGMWIDEHGRAVRLVEGRVLSAAHSELSFKSDLQPGGTQRFELRERDRFAVHGAGWRLALWQGSS